MLHNFKGYNMAIVLSCQQPFVAKYDKTARDELLYVLESLQYLKLQEEDFSSWDLSRTQVQWISQCGGRMKDGTLRRQ